MIDFTKSDALITELEETINKPKKIKEGDKLLVGVDLGTAYIVLVVLDEDKNPVACDMEFAQVVKDGLVVDYIGAMNIVRKLKKRIEDKIEVELTKAAIAVPPGTGKNDSKTHMYVVQGAGMEVTNILDEPTAANAVLNIDNGVIVDIGGGTTGLSIIEDNEVVYVADEATGGTHLTLVIAGSYKIKFEEAEELKTARDKQKEVFPVVIPVIQKMGTIVKNHIQNYDVKEIYLVGGTSCLEGLEGVMESETKIRTIKPKNPFLVTPLGIAMNCKL
ncbi:ethanolamine utilization protein EutJ [Clostridium sp. D2Q-11]|uniref:Chaperone protein DnaK n=1 Tax=Anaeromonas frigoriresistens TaxID=2683708 RepID=A0A942Z8C8_9FIRM|nr:ethanolamine utilization protein EutJ [Anaeromonas frigoriresistens]MBS4537849.1 ethanolamine utilization protein EutJ [Anaeromonas frigoriresistens]